MSDRGTALAGISSRLALIGEEIQRTIPRVQVRLTGGHAPKLQVNTPGARIKIEPSTIIRGSLFAPVDADLCQAAQQEFELFLRARNLSNEDLYGGKLCAVLDRQHPRDLFDIMPFQAAGGVPDATRQAFVAYVAGHRRPMAELLAPKWQPIDDLYSRHFSGMTN